MLRRIHAPDKGAGLTEYAAVVLLVAALVATIGIINLDDRVGRLFSTGVDCVERRSDDCVETGGGTDAPEPEGTGTPMAGPVSPAPRESYECGIFQVACDLGQGAASETSDLVTDAWDGVRGTGCLVHICSNEEFRGTWSGVGESAEMLFTDPLGAAEESWNEFTDGPQEDWSNGDETRAVGRGIILGASSIFGLGPLRLLPDRRPTPDRPAGDYRADAAEAARRGDVSSAERNAELAEQVAQDSEAAARENPDDLDLQDQAERDRREADQAALEVHGARAVEQMLEIPIGRELNGSLNRNGTEIEFSPDPRMDGTAQYDPATDTITIGRNFLDRPDSVLTLVHEAAHARREHGNENFPPVGHSRDDYVQNQLENEADSQISEFQAAEELRSQGHDIPLDPREEYYNDRYLHWLGYYEDNGAPGAAAETIAAAAARDDLAQEIGNMINSVDGTPYRDYYGNFWDSVNGG
ncbi:hypothetical protein O4J56_14960 [Nocardiopsis sp. RSe5-2]|uniref:Uncharacterized protein n=1 Tax=Nocardiopsis endophytica TaxID=3018445 RepID=A0ABT4U4S6_9ACTN|nr:DUF6782 family putative metallopeptidase [Nocardiopsis endophytica]MDA2811942.1 hypothetical protein [Nocardiopsis endophytica]